MCRLFGFRSVIQSQVHRSLVGADNALAVQSGEHPDGWGVAWYLGGVPHLLKGTKAALEDNIFDRVSGVVASETVLAHIRRATTGQINTLNTHPFQFGQWVFAHNGQVHDYAGNRERLRAMIAPTLRRYVLGDTDSEVLFFLFMSELMRRADVQRRGTPIEDIVGAMRHVLARVQEVCDGPGEDQKSLLTAIVTDGQAMVGFKMRKPLLFSTWKRGCLDKEPCPFLAPECLAPTTTGHVNHLIISSEQLGGENVWEDLGDGEVIGVDWRMTLHRGAVGGPMLPVVPH